ncbi:hypothetical protein ACI7BZ_11415 [Xanthobacter sp. AM11]|uniref:hypothetical protein n=1 Tax=Xanthobacter sp. AM11 TaxID=3380643 RepID=UPI0039BF6100
MEPVLIDNGKQPSDPLHIDHRLVWLPPDTPYGNMNLKLIKIIMCADEANLRIIDAFYFWNILKMNDINSGYNAYPRHIFATEQAIYLMRRIADDLISMIWMLDQKRKTGSWPTRIKIDSIGRALQEHSIEESGLLDRNRNNLQTMNDISNAFKHSFVHSDLNIAGELEPVVNALALTSNNLTNPAKLHSHTVAKIVSDFNNFYRDCMECLQKIGKEIKTQDSSVNSPNSFPNASPKENEPMT